MRHLVLDTLVVTALLAWRLRRRGALRAALVVAILGGPLALASIPHTLWGWQVQQHVSLGYLRVQMLLTAAWLVTAALVGCALWIWDAIDRTPHDPRKRRLLAQAPLALSVMAPAGIAEAARAPELRTVRISHPRLPRGFGGLRILQVSDLHLGPALGLEWLDAALARAPAVDLVALTGDFSNDLALLPIALKRLVAVNAPLGHFAIPGNHEHYIDIDAYEDAVRASGIKLVTGQRVSLARNGDAVELIGIDYPHLRKVKNEIQFADMLDAALAGAPSGFKLLLSHHPDAFDEAVARGVDVQISGHTHGGQIELFGWTPLARWWLKYPRGHYTQGAAQLFVTTGLGHWMPFRIDCPTELPVIELVRA